MAVQLGHCLLRDVPDSRGRLDQRATPAADISGPGPSPTATLHGEAIPLHPQEAEAMFELGGR
jgi:hypothetical protein